MSFPDPNAPFASTSAAGHQFYASALARYVVRRRTDLGMTVDSAAKLAGMEISEWLALENNWIPAGREQQWPIAEVLEVRTSQIAVLALISQASQLES